MADEAGLTAEQRREKRRKEAYPVIRVFEKWMKDVLRQIPYYKRDGRDLDELLPRAWKARHEQVTTRGE